MQILFTGASSFTGYWFVEALIRRGHVVVAPLRGELDKTHNTPRGRRLHLLQKNCEIVPNAPFGSNSFQQLIEKTEGFDLFCHHAAETSGYTEAGFDVDGAVEKNCFNLTNTLEALKGKGCNKLILTGSVSEMSESWSYGSLRAFGGYGLSKRITSNRFQEETKIHGIEFRKFTVANPFGPLENPKFPSYLASRWRRKETAEVRTPEYVRDNIHVSLLAEAYHQFADRKAENDHLISFKPSGYIGTQASFAKRLAVQFGSRLGWECSLSFANQTDFSEPMCMVNTDKVCEPVLNWDEEKAWDEFVAYYSIND